MKDFLESIKELYSKDRLVLILMGLNVILALALLIFALVNLNPASAVVKIAYGDIVGYVNGSWWDMLAYPLLAIIFGFLHSVIAVRIYKKRGAGMAKFFLAATAGLILGTFIVLLRLLERI